MATPLPFVAKARHRVRPESVDELIDVAAKAETGEVSAFAYVAIGPDFANWYGRTITTRQDRMNLLGQLELLRNALVQDEIESQ
jgi:hypothetical protein